MYCCIVLCIVLYCPDMTSAVDWALKANYLSSPFLSERNPLWTPFKSNLQIFFSRKQYILHRISTLIIIITRCVTFNEGQGQYN